MGESVEQTEKPIKHKRKLRWIIPLVAIILTICAAAAWLYSSRNTSPIPKDFQKSVSFPIYYPDPKKLPSGYVLDTNSFTSPTTGVLLYSVNYNNNQKLIFSLQQKPSDNDINNFNTQRIPLHTEFATPVGTATIGAIGEQSIISLPTNSTAWIIITGPYRIDQKQLKQVLQAIRQAN